MEDTFDQVRTWPGSGETEIRVLKKNILLGGRLAVAGETVNVPKQLVAQLVAEGKIEPGEPAAQHFTRAQIVAAKKAAAAAAEPARAKPRRYVTTDDVPDITDEVDMVTAGQTGRAGRGIMPVPVGRAMANDVMFTQESTTANKTLVQGGDRINAGRVRNV